ncbi:MAG TPA: hypothetical protein PKG98_05855 [Myxococcota bacterium]|nr:hypothetical protein [Myxococcota bacterium]
MTEMRLLSWSLVCLVLLTVGCGSVGTDDILSPSDVPDAFADLVDAPDSSGQTDVDSHEVGQTGDASDSEVVSDTADDVYVPPEPDPTFIHEVRVRETCVADGPWKIDGVLQFRDAASGFVSLDIRAVTVSGDLVWALSSEGLYRMVYVTSGLPATFERVMDAGAGSLIAPAFAADSGLIMVDGDTLTEFVGELTDSRTVSLPSAAESIIFCGDDAWAVAGGTLFRLPDDGPAQSLDVGVQPSGLLACRSGSLLFAVDSAVYELVDPSDPSTATQRYDGGEVALTALAAGSLMVAVGAGDDLVLLDGSTWTPVTISPGKGGLPTGSIRALSVSLDDRFVAIAHEVGVTVLDLTPGDTESLAVGRISIGDDTVATVDHFTSGRWLPANSASDLFLSTSAAGLWVATPAGLSRISSQAVNLADKAERMFDNMNRWFWRLEGFVTAAAQFESAFSDVRLPLQDNDNDGQWTQEAVGALCYAYATTGDERYYEAARKAITNMAMQIDIPAQDFIDAGLGRGFVTRSFVRDDEGEVFTSKAGLSNWHLVEDYIDGHDYYWKDDTSSDEMTGHFYGFSIYYDLCAKDDAEREWVAEHLTALVGYILDHGLLLLDLDHQPTEHGKYSPEYLAVAVDGLEACSMQADLETCIGSYYGGAFLDSTEILGGLLAAWHVSGDRRFYDAYDTLINEHRYDELATFHNEVLTWANPSVANYCDHELSDLALLTLIRYEQRDDRRAIWIKSMLDAWEYEIGERNPLKTLTMAAAIPAPPGVENGVSTLVDFPEDQRDYEVDNSHRLDGGKWPKDRFERPQFNTVFPYDEVLTMRWDANPYRVVGGGNPASRRAPNFWLLPYWGLRYYNVICE